VYGEGAPAEESRRHIFRKKDGPGRGNGGQENGKTIKQGFSSGKGLGGEGKARKRAGRKGKQEHTKKRGGFKS